MLGLSGYAKAPQLFVQFAHEFAHAFVDAAVVVVLAPVPWAASRPSVWPQTFRSSRRSNRSLSTRKYSCPRPQWADRHRFGIAKRAQHTQSLFIERLHAAQHGVFWSSVAGIGAERRGNVQRGAQHKSGGGGVPRWYPRASNVRATRRKENWKRRSAFGKHFAGKIQDRLALLYTVDKAVVLAAARARHGAEPVDVMRRTLPMAQACMAFATISATSGFQGLPSSRISRSDHIRSAAGAHASRGRRTNGCRTARTIHWPKTVPPL